MKQQQQNPHRSVRRFLKTVVASPQQRKRARELLLVLGLALICAALIGYDWRVGVGFIGAAISAGALWGLFRGE